MNTVSVIMLLWAALGCVIVFKKDSEDAAEIITWLALAPLAHIAVILLYGIEGWCKKSWQNY